MFLSVLMGAAVPAAGHAGEFWLHTGGVSAHNSSNPRNETNPGIGLEYRFGSDWALAAGRYENSFSRMSNYAMASWTPLQRGPMRFGLTGGLVTGYYKKKLGMHGQAVPMLLPTLDLTHGRHSLAVMAAPPMGDLTRGSVMALFKFSFSD